MTDHHHHHHGPVDVLSWLQEQVALEDELEGQPHAPRECLPKVEINSINTWANHIIQSQTNDYMGDQQVMLECQQSGKYDQYGNLIGGQIQYDEFGNVSQQQVNQNPQQLQNLNNYDQNQYGIGQQQQQQQYDPFGNAIPQYDQFGNPIPTAIPANNGVNGGYAASSSSSTADPNANSATNPSAKVKDPILQQIGSRTIDPFDSPFLPDHNLNQRIRLFMGNVGSLAVDVASCEFSYPVLTRGNGRKILPLGGGKLVREITSAIGVEGRLKSGEAALVKSNFGNMNSNKIGLFIGPNYKPKYKTAARNTLTGCIRNVIGLVQEECINSKSERASNNQNQNNGDYYNQSSQGSFQVRTVAIPCLFSDEKCFPLEENVHVVCRALRRWLPKLDRIRGIVLYTENQNEYACYEKVLQLYFPRSDMEREIAISRLRREYQLICTGTTNSVNQNNNAAGPGANNNGNQNQNLDQSGNHPENSGAQTKANKEDHPIYTLQGPIDGFNWGTDSADEIQEKDRSLHVSKLVVNREDEREELQKHGLENASAFTAFTADWNQKETDRLAADLWSANTTEDLHHIYIRYLREAHSKQYSQTMKELKQCNFLYSIGSDMGGRPLILLSEHTIPIVRYDHDSLLRFIVSFLDQISNSPFVLVYAHAGVGQSQNILEILKELIRISQFKYGNTLNFIVLHPTVAFKGAFSLLSYYIPERIYNESIYCESIQELESYVGKRGLDLHGSVRSYEAERGQTLFGSLW